MARRSIPLVSGEVYHLYNRSIAHAPIFTKARDYQRFLEVIDFYRFNKPGIRFSHYNRLQVEEKFKYLKTLYETGKMLIEIFAFSLMPNHFHILAKQLQDEGIKIFMSQIQNSYAKYFNTKYKRTGGLFQEMFKAVRIESDEQLIHVTRYIHINPLTSFVIKEIAELENYPWTSYVDYMGNRHLPLLNTHLFTNYFSKVKKLKDFTFNQIDYQRTLQNIKHLMLE